MLKELRNQNRTIIQMVFSGYKNKEIAERLEMSDCTVSQIVRSPLGQAYLEGLQDKAQEATLDVRKKLVSMNKSALNVLERIMNPAEKASHAVQLTAAKDVLDRTGYKAPDRLHVDMTMQTKTDQEIDAEITAMQQSISKTYLQDPIKQSADKNTSEDKNILFTDERTRQAERIVEADTIDYEEVDSFDQLVNSYQNSSQDDIVSLHDEFQSSPEATSKESASLLSKVPANIFRN